jgi:hypothetical protein
VNLDIGQITSRKRNLYEIALEMILMERRLPSDFCERAKEPLRRLFYLAGYSNPSKVKILYELALEVFLLEHHLEEEYRY